MFQMFFVFDLFVIVRYCSVNMTNEFDNPAPPDIVLREALNEPSPRLLDDYIEAIQALKNKRFTFREIAEWLQQFGIEADHNAVYRAYSKTVSDYEAAIEGEEDEQLERQEAYKDALRNGQVRTVVSNVQPVPEPAKAATAAKNANKTKKVKGQKGKK